MAYGNGNGGRTPWVATNIVAPLVVAVIVAAVLGLSGWAWALQTGHAAQGAAIDVHESRIDGHDKTIDRMDLKLDRILERLGGP